MNITERVYQALMDSKKLTAQLVKDRKGRCIYHGISPDAGSYPILVYSMISDVPALAADGEEQEQPLHGGAPRRDRASVARKRRGGDAPLARAAAPSAGPVLPAAGA